MIRPDRVAFPQCSRDRTRATTKVWSADDDTNLRTLRRSVRIEPLTVSAALARRGTKSSLRRIDGSYQQVGTRACGASSRRLGRAVAACPSCASRNRPTVIDLDRAARPTPRLSETVEYRSAVQPRFHYHNRR